MRIARRVSNLQKIESRLVWENLDRVNIYSTFEAKKGEIKCSLNVLWCFLGWVLRGEMSKYLISPILSQKIKRDKMFLNFTGKNWVIEMICFTSSSEYFWNRGLRPQNISPMAALVIEKSKINRTRLFLWDHPIHMERERESLNAQPAGCMHAKLSLTSAYSKLGHSHSKNNFCIYLVIELSQLMLNLDVVIARSFLCRALAMHSLWEYYDLYGLFQRRLNLEKLTMATWHIRTGLCGLMLSAFRK